jgi:hypothetical protein
MVHYGVAPPYLSPSHPTKGDDSSRGSQNRDAIGSYTRSCKNIDHVGAGVVTTSKPKNLVSIYGQKSKFMAEHVWFTSYRSKGHCRYKCPVLPNYMATGVSTPFPSVQYDWCEIYK